MTERIREIGTLKAIGAQNTTILALFLAEAILIGMIGATLGIAIGMGGGYLMSMLTSVHSAGPMHGTKIPPIYSPSDLVKVWVLSVTLSIAAGVFPAWNASNLSPLVALRRD